MGDETDWIPWVPGTGGKGPRDPKTTPLTDFPQMPVLFYQQGDFGAGLVRKYIEAKHVMATPVWLHKRALLARAWVRIAQRVAPKKASSQAWAARVEHEFSAWVLQGQCVVNCEWKYLQLYQIANAAQYLAGMWSPTKVHPPTLPPDASILKMAGDWAGEQAGDLVGSKIGLYVGIGLVGLLALKFIPSRK